VEVGTPLLPQLELNQLSLEIGDSVWDVGLQWGRDVLQGFVVLNFKVNLPLCFLLERSFVLLVLDFLCFFGFNE